jgi:hypothetical protein
VPHLHRMLLPIAVALSLAVSACSYPTPDPNSPWRDSSTSRPPAKAPSAVAVSKSAAPTLNAHGNITSKLGDKIVVNFADGREAVSFAVTEIQVAPTCDGNKMWRLPSSYGHFVALKMTITTSADYVDGIISGGELMRVFWNEWAAYAADGSELEHGNAGLFCLSAAKNLPLDIPAGTTTVGYHVMDLSTKTASVAWQPTALVARQRTQKGWEWSTSK